MSDQRYKVIGTKGRLEIDQKNRGVEFVSETEGIQQLNPYFSEYLEDADGNVQFQGYGHKSIAQFLADVEKINNGITNREKLARTRPDLVSSLVSTAVVDVVNQSLKQHGAWISVPEIKEIKWS